MAAEKGIIFDLKKCIISEDLAYDRLECRNIIYIDDPIIAGTQGCIDDDDVIFGLFYVK